jgi:hypothetical protein
LRNAFVYKGRHLCLGARERKDKLVGTIAKPRDKSADLSDSYTTAVRSKNIGEVVTVVGAILTAIQPHPDALGPPEPPWRVFGQGVVVNVLNPKCALYFLAFLPQFVDPSAGTAWSQVLVLGISFVVLGLLTNGLYALAGGAAGEWMRRRGSSAVRRAQR